MTELVVHTGLPSRACHPNARSRSHWPRARAIAKARASVQLCALEALNGREPPRWERATLTIHFNFHVGSHPNARETKHDADNLTGWAKGLRDGLQVKDGAGIVVNDNGLSLTGDPTYSYDATRPAGVTLTIRPVGGVGGGTTPESRPA